MNNMNNRTCPCKEMSFSIYNYKHTELIITRSFSYASCCSVVYSTQDLLPFSPRFSILKALAGHKGENWRRAFFSRSFVPPAIAAFICLADTAVKI